MTDSALIESSIPVYGELTKKWPSDLNGKLLQTLSPDLLKIFRLAKTDTDQVFIFFLNAGCNTTATWCIRKKVLLYLSSCVVTVWISLLAVTYVPYSLEAPALAF